MNESVDGRETLPCTGCRGTGRVEVVSWIAFGLAPIWLGGFSAGGLLLQGRAGEIGVPRWILVLASVGALGIIMILVIESGFWSCLIRIVELYRWIFLGRLPECPRCRGTGHQVPPSDRVPVFGLVVLMVIVLGALWFLGQAVRFSR